MTGLQYIWHLLKGILITVDPSVLLDTKWKCQLNGLYNQWVKALQMFLQGLFGDSLYLIGSSSQAPVGFRESWKVLKKVAGCPHRIICSGPHTVGAGKRCVWYIPLSKSLCHSLSNCSFRFIFLPLTHHFTLLSPLHMLSVYITASMDEIECSSWFQFAHQVAVRQRV